MNRLFVPQIQHEEAVALVTAGIGDRSLSDSGAGKLSLLDLSRSVERGEIDTVLAVFTDMYGRLVGKRLDASHFVSHVAEDGMHVCDYLLACDMEMDPVPGYRLTSWESGYGDHLCRPDLSTLRQASWLDRSAIALCDLYSMAEAAPVEVSPRRILQRQVERAQAAGFRVMAGLEIEFYLFDETYDGARSKSYRGLVPSSPYIEDYQVFLGTRSEGFLGAVRRNLAASGIPVESSKGEWGPGQQEVNIAFSESVEQADRTALLKQIIRETALQMGKAVTFMAKWDEDLAGSSMHAHVSLWDAGGETNRFAGDLQEGPLRVSAEFRGFLGGWMRRSRELAPFYAPNVSSYKRFQSGSFAPTAIGWSRDNRTAGFRVVGSGPSLRIECRLAGADANPYLVLASAIAAGLDGVEKGIEPPAQAQGDLYLAKDAERVPTTLREGIEALDASDFARRAFGDEVVEQYLHFFRTEQRKFDSVVTDWEKQRYFERI